MAKHKDKESYYQALTNLNNPSKVINTIIEIMIDFYRKNPTASFGFIGINSENEPYNNTKRFRIYKKLMENFFSENKFLHYSFTSKSAYLMLNRTNASQETLEKIENFGIFHFPLKVVDTLQSRNVILKETVCIEKSPFLLHFRVFQQLTNGFFQNDKKKSVNY